MTAGNQQETFEQFRKSFSYGSRNDLSFKFLANLTDAEAARFIQGLLQKLGDAYDDGDLGRIWEHAVEGQVQGYSFKVEWTYPEGPFQPLKKPLSQSRLVLLTSSGHFVEGEDSQPLGVKNMTQEEAVQRVKRVSEGGAEAFLHTPRYSRRKTQGPAQRV